jgi:hypothetical protein
MILTSRSLTDYFIQDIEQQENALNGHSASLITDLKRSKARKLIITAFDAVISLVLIQSVRLLVDGLPGTIKSVIIFRPLQSRSWL